MPSIRVRVTDSARGGLLRQPNKSVGQVAKQLLLELLAGPEQPAPEPINGTDVSISLTLWLSNPEATRLTGLATQAGYDSLGEYATALLNATTAAYARAHPPSPEAVAAEAAAVAAATLLDGLNAALNSTTRPEQALFHRHLLGFLNAAETPPHGVLFAEAATGVGKTRAYLASVIEWSVRHPDQCAVLAYPTLATLQQAVAEWQVLATHFNLPRHVALASQREFVSVTALEAVLGDSGFRQEPPTAEEKDALRRARAWLKNGGPPDPASAFAHRWTVSGLMAATHDGWGWPDDVRLDQRLADDDPGMLAYRAQFAHADHGHRIVFCTHAMLGVHVREQISAAVRSVKQEEGAQALSAHYKEYWSLDEAARADLYVHQLADYLFDHLSTDAGRLPPIGLLIVDEAHAIENSFASVFSYGFSLWKLKDHLRTLKYEQQEPELRQRDIDGIHHIFAELQALGEKRQGDALPLDADSGARQHIVAIVEILNRFKTGKKGKTKANHATAVGRAALRMLSALQMALKIQPDANYGSIGEIEWSPTRQYPRINVGRFSVERELAFLWQSLAAHSILVSGTLYDFGTDNSPEAMRQLLAVQRDLLCVAPPVRPAWVYTPVTLYTPARAHTLNGRNRYSVPDDPAERARFYKPTARDSRNGLAADRWQEFEAQWADEIADYLAQVHATAAGGSLVLGRSYADLEAWRLRLEPRLGADLIVQRERHPLADDKAAYLARAAAGGKPMLLGLGAAWTGLDLSLPMDPATNQLLTDLVIPLAPLGVNRSLTHRYRRQKRGAYVEAIAATMLFRQGIGRLVRGPGIPGNRRLHFLDARMHDIGWNAFLSPIMRVLRVYHRRIEV